MKARNTRSILVVAASLLIAALVVGCDQSAPDQCVRREIFLQCMGALPAGPQATKYNDWDDVVSTCDSVAHYQSLRGKESIAANCRVR